MNKEFFSPLTSLLPLTHVFHIDIYPFVENDIYQLFLIQMWSKALEHQKQLTHQTFHFDK